MTRILIAILFLFPSVLSAQSVRVLGGEHGDFTRLTFRIPAGTDWELRTTEPGFSLQFSKPVEGFDLSKAFDRIRRERILKIVAAEDRSALDVVLGCDCKIETFRAGPNLMAVDLTGAPDGRGLLEIREPEKPNRTPLQDRLSFGILPVIPERKQDFHIAPMENIGPIADLGDMKGKAEALKNAEDEALQNRLRVAKAEQQLLKHIGRAATQGLLTKSSDDLPKQRNQSLEPPVEKKSTQVETDKRTLDAPSHHLLLHAENAMQSALLGLPERMQETRTGVACLADEVLAIEKWGSEERPFGEQVAEYRSALYGEFDRLNYEAARNLARIYLYFGFGAEASHAISLTSTDDPAANALIMSVARIMDHGADDNPGPLIGQMSCDTNAALWSVLSERNLPRGVHFNESAMLRSFSALPKHLKQSLGPALSSKLLAADARGTAEAIMRILERGSEEKSPQMQMIEADMHLDVGSLDEASNVLEEVVEENTELSPGALVKMIDSDMTRGHRVQPETVDLVASYVFEYQDTPSVENLKRVLVLARASAGQFDAALKNLSEIENNFERKSLLSIIFERIQAEADEAEFLRLSFAMPEDHRSGLEPALGNTMAERLLDIGFPEAAAEFVKFAADGADGRERRILRAKIALSQNRPRRAEGDVLGLSGLKVDEIRAKARAMTGDFKAAKNVYAAAGLSDEEMEAAWLAGDWKSVQNSENSTIANTAELLLQAEATTAETDNRTSLESNRSLLEESAGARDTLRALLAEMELGDALEQTE